jgi:hypothetical protein
MFSGIGKIAGRFKLSSQRLEKFQSRADNIPIIPPIVFASLTEDM